MDSHDDNWIPFGLGAISACAFLAIAVSCAPGSAIREVNLKKEACEKSLPRDQRCVMRYEPEPPHDPH